MFDENLPDCSAKDQLKLKGIGAASPAKDLISVVTIDSGYCDRSNE